MVELKELLDASVRNATGLPEAEPRPGQWKLSKAVADVLLTGEGDVAGIAPTGTGKSLAYLAPAAKLACSGGRTLISTESLALQDQIVNKDFPAVKSALKELAGRDIEIAVHKGWSNYVCLASAQDYGQSLAGPGSTDEEIIDHPMATPLLKWALSPDNRDGDRANFPGAIRGEEWDKVSTTPDACLRKSCPFIDDCFPMRARQRASEADVIVTNHHLLAVQATKGVPVVLGSKALGELDAIVIDEAHTLPGVVRNQGATAISSRRLLSALRTLENNLPPGDPQVQVYGHSGSNLGEQLDAVISELIEETDDDGKIEGDHDPLGGLSESIQIWCKELINAINIANHAAKGAQEVRAKKAVGRIHTLISDLNEVTRGGAGIARWVEVDERAGRKTPTLNSSLVDVSGPLHHNVYNVPLPDEGAETQEQTPDRDWVDDELPAEDPPWETPQRRLPVAAVSATIPKSFPHDAGLQAPITEYESPFSSAYGSSLLYIPRPIVDGVKVPTRTFGGGRESMNTYEHTPWAGRIMKRLVESAGGRALVLSATAKAGKEYAELLRIASGGRWAVFSQWDGVSKDITTRKWREDETAVLVGTRSYMTGVDAPGSTCSLVIVDRVPRGAGNVVDDARVEVLAEDMSEFRARDLVYAVDAAQLLEQAAGRLIRSMSDAGVVAVLDPRLLKGKSISYPAPTRKIYMHALRFFPEKTARLSNAESFLKELTSGVAEAA